MAVLLLAALLLALGVGSDANWCVCRSDVSDAALQKALDYACGAGADCSPILQNNACFQPNTVRAHCSYAVNSYFQRKGQAAGTCDFSGAATVTTTDPSYNTCSYPASASSAGTTPTTTPSTTPTTPPSTATPTSTAPPFSTTPMTGSPTTTTFTPPTGGILGGLGPSGVGISTDASGKAAGLLFEAGFFTTLVVCAVSGALLLQRN